MKSSRQAWLLLVLAALLGYAYWSSLPQRPPHVTAEQRAAWDADSQARTDEERYHGYWDPEMIDKPPASAKVTSDLPRVDYDTAALRQVFVDLRNARTAAQVEAIRQKGNDYLREQPRSGFYEIIETALLTRPIREWGNPPWQMLAAHALVDAALRKNPWLAEAYLQRARLKLMDQDAAEALRALDLAASLEPDHPELLRHRAQLLSKRMDFDESQDWFRRYIDAVEDDAGKWYGHYWLARSQWREADRKRELGQADVSRELADTSATLKHILTPGWSDYGPAVFGAWFFNRETGDFAAAADAARLAQANVRGGDEADAREELAIALYQQLAVDAATFDDARLARALDDVRVESGLTLEEVMAIGCLGPRVTSRLTPLRAMRDRNRDPQEKPAVPASKCDREWQ